MIGIDEFFGRVAEFWRPPKKLKLSEWADEHYYLSPESSAAPGRWHTLPYQREIMDCISDPRVEMVTLKKSARVGATKIINATIGYYIHHDPCPMLVVQPSIEDAQGYSKEEIVPMLRDCKVLTDLVTEGRQKVSDNTILSKTFPGGLLTMIGANSARGFRRVSRRVVMFDEVDAYPPSAGNEGDPIELGIKRSDYYWNRKIIAVSTPVTEGSSRIDDLYDDGDQRKYHVPCPHCGHLDTLEFSESDDGGHYMHWPEGVPKQACFVCSKNGCIIEESSKAEMLAKGVWIASKDFDRHASFSIWAAYSVSPNTTWEKIAAAFEKASKKGQDALKVFTNTVLGQTWKDKGEAPPYKELYRRRESYPIGVVPKQVKLLTCGVDVQKDRLIYEVVGWDYNLESWSIDADMIFGDTAESLVWDELDKLIKRPFERSGSEETIGISMTAIDSGYRTQQVYSRCARWSIKDVIAVKGSSSIKAMVGVPSDVEIKSSGRRYRRGYKVWVIGQDIAKSEFYGFLGMKHDGETNNPTVPHHGWCHFPEYGEEFFMQITAEQLITTRKKSGFTVNSWQVIPNRENHWLDTRVYARCAAAVLGLDRISAQMARKEERENHEPTTDAPKVYHNRPNGNHTRPRSRNRGGWIPKRGKGWFNR